VKLQIPLSQIDWNQNFPLDYLLVCGSWWGFPPNFILILIIVIHTALQDRTLQKELPGYGEYAQKVKYRLVPFIW
jgi:protein-S-isoprenylcysteine O-methyltransferase Ste14